MYLLIFGYWGQIHFFFYPVKSVFFSSTCEFFPHLNRGSKDRGCTDFKAHWGNVILGYIHKIDLINELYSSIQYWIYQIFRFSVMKYHYWMSPKRILLSSLSPTSLATGLPCNSLYHNIQASQSELFISEKNCRFTCRGQTRDNSGRERYFCMPCYKNRKLDDEIIKKLINSNIFSFLPRAVQTLKVSHVQWLQWLLKAARWSATMTGGSPSTQTRSR